MSIRVSPPVELRTAEDLCRFYQIKLKTGHDLLRPEMTPRAFFDALLEQKHLADARRILAHALPCRKALWWGCLCALDVYRTEPSPSVNVVLEAICRFVQCPRDDSRRQAFELRREVRSGSLEHCLATAVFFSGGSISRPDLPYVAPKPWVTGRLVSVAVYLAAVKRDPRRYKDYLRQYLSVGLEVMRAETPWKNAVQTVLLVENLPSQENHPQCSDIVVSRESLLG